MLATMQKISTFLLFLSCLFLFSPQLARSSHTLCSDLTYQYGCPIKYEGMLRFEWNCSGFLRTLPVYETTISYNSYCGSGITIIDAIGGAETEISVGFYAPCMTTCCQGGFGLGVRDCVYESNVTLTNT